MLFSSDEIKIYLPLAGHYQSLGFMEWSPLPGAEALGRGYLGEPPDLTYHFQSALSCVKLRKLLTNRFYQKCYISCWVSFSFYSAACSLSDEAIWPVMLGYTTHAPYFCRSLFIGITPPHWESQLCLGTALIRTSKINDGKVWNESTKQYSTQVNSSLPSQGCRSMHSRPWETEIKQFNAPSGSL